jgi:flagellin-specific chaperone FliS
MDDLNEARKLIEEDKRRREAEAVARIKAVLDELQCDLGAVVGVGGRLVDVPVEVHAR